MKFKDILKSLRKEKRLTQKEVAHELNVSPDSIYNWERGRSEPSIDDLINLADFFNVTIDYLVGRREI